MGCSRTAQMIQLVKVLVQILRSSIASAAHIFQLQLEVDRSRQRKRSGKECTRARTHYLTALLHGQALLNDLVCSAKFSAVGHELGTGVGGRSWGVLRQRALDVIADVVFRGLFRQLHQTSDDVNVRQLDAERRVLGRAKVAGLCHARR